MDMCNCLRKLTTFISLFFLISISAWGETYYFTGADSFNPTLWSVLDNWNTSADGTGTTPTSLLNTDDIIIPVGQTVTVDTDADILSIENNGTLIFNDSCSSFTATAKTNGNGSTVIYDGATALLWGTDYANLKIESGTSITLGASDITIATGSSLENNGTIVYTDTGRIKQGTGGTVLNDTNGTVEYSTGSGTISPVAYGNLKISSGTWEWAAASASPSPSVANLTATGGTFKITAPFYYANALDLSATSVELSSTLSSDAGITVANITVDGTVEITGSSITQTTGTIQAAGNNADNLTLKTSGILSLNQLGTSTNSFASITIDSDTTALSFTSTRTIYSANLKLKGTSVSANDLTYDGNLQIDTAGSSTLSNIEAKTITYTQTPSACNYKNSISLTDSATDFVIDYAATLIGNTQFTSANKFILNAAGDISGTYDLELSGTNGIELQKDLGTSSSAFGIITLKNDTEVTDSVSVYSSSLQLADGITLSAAGSGDLTVNADLITLGELENNISLNAEKDVGAGGNISGSGELIFTGTNDQNFTPSSGSSYVKIKENKTSGALTVNADLNATSFTITNGVTTEFTQAATITTFTDSAAAGNITFYDNTTIAANTTFATTGTVTFGDDSGTTASPQEYTFGTSPSYASFTHSSGTTKINGCVKINASNITTGTVSATTDSSDELYLVSSSGSFSTGQIGDSGTEIKKLTFDSGASDISFNGSSSTLYADTINFITSGSISLLNLTALSELNLDTTNIVSLSNITIPSLSFIQAPSSINLSGTITVNGTAGLTLSNSVNLTGNTTITTPNGPLSLYDNISGSSYTLIITNSDTFTLNDATNDSDPTEITSTPSSALSVSSFTQNGTGPVSISGDISATSAISFASALTLTGNVNFSADTITLNNSISGTGNTYLASTSGTTLNGTSTIGSTSVEVTGPLYTDTSANITVNSPLTAHGNFTNNGTVSASTTSDITVKGDFSDNGIWQSTHKLIFNSTDDQSFTPKAGTTYTDIQETKTAGTLTVTDDLNATSFTITNGTTTTFAQNATINTLTDSTSAGNITFSGNTTIGTNTTFATTGTVTFSQTSSCQNLTHTEGDTSITGTLNAATVTLGTTTFTGTITTTGNQTYNGKVTGGAMTFANSGILTISDTVDATDIDSYDISCSSFTQSGTGPVSISGDISATSAISFASALTLTGNVNFSADTITLNNSISGTGNTYLASTSGTTLNGTSTIGSTSVEVTGPLYTDTSANITVNSPLTAHGNFTNNGTVSASTTSDITVKGDFTDNGIWQSTHKLIFNSTDDQSFKPNSSTTYFKIDENKTAGTLTVTAVLNATSFTITNGTTTTFAQNATINTLTDSTSAGNITFSGDTTIGTDTTFATTGTVTFSQTSSCQNLTHEAGVTSITGTLNAATVTLGTTTFTGTITTTGNQNYTSTVSGGEMIFTGAAITFNNTVNSSAPITITNSGILTISDTVNATDIDSYDISCSGFTQSGPGPVSISGDISSSADISFAGAITLTGYVILSSNRNIILNKQVADSPTQTNNFSLSAVNISFKDDVTAGGTISVEISGFFKTDDGKNISFGTGFTQTGTGKTMLGGNFTGNADASFNSDLYLYGSNSQFGNAGQTISTDANIVIAKTTPANTLNIKAITTCKNFVLYNGDVTLNNKLTTTEDCILLSSNYSVKDEQTNLDNIYTYSNRPAGWSEPNYNSGAWETSYPDTTAAWPVSGTNFGGKLTVADGKEISVGKNFYSNGITLSGTPGAANWYINIPDNTNPANCFAEAYNTNVSNCTVRCKDDNSADGSKSQIVFEPGEHNGICNANCQNFDTQTFTITNARTERDNAIYIEFNRPARASITTTQLWNLSYSVSSTQTVPAFTGIFSDPDCQATQNSDSSSFFLQAKDTWNTDATGTDAGKTESTDRKGIHKTNVPYLRVPRSTEGSHYIITDRFGKRLQNYSEVTSNTYTSIPDYTGPVLYSVRTGQENHTPYDNTKGASSQPSYDSHNFIEFRYSEEVNFGTPSASSTDIWLAASDVTFTDGIPDITNICVNDNFGALSNTNLTDEADLSITGLGKLEKGKIYTGSNGSPDRYVNALYRTDKYSIRLSIAGLTDGTVLDRDGNTYKKWKGYIEQAIIPTGTINILTNSGNSNTLVTDCALALDGTTPLYNPQKLYSSNMTIPEVNKITSDGSDYPDEGIYGNWDISEPVFAPLRLKSSIAWNECSPTDESFYEAVGNTSGAGSTLDRIEFHFFDNTPDYDSDPFAWLTEKGWCFSSSENAETLYDENYTYCADIIGGSRGFSADPDNRTTGGIRYSTIAQLNSSFKYIDNQFDNSEITKDFVSGVNGVFIGAKAPLFVGSSPLRRSATNVDGLYFSLQLSESNYPLIQAFKVSYDDTTGFVTDLAGNRLRSAKIKTIDRTPPTIDFILGPLNQNELYMAFVKELVTKSDSISYMDENGTAYGISETFENLIPKCFEIFSIDENGTPTASEELQIDYSIPAVIENIESKVNGQPFTIIRLKLTQNITLPRLQNLYIKLKNADDYHEFSQDPITGLNNSRVTFIQDYFGNYMQMYSAHSLSDFAISSINPLYAYDADMNYNDSYFMEHLYSDETWSVHDWNKDQQNYGTLPANHPYGLVADLKDGTPENKSVPYGARLFLSASPTEGSIFQQYNSDFNQNVRIWLPEIENSDFSFMVTEPNPLSNYSTVDSTKLNSESNERILFSIPKEISQGWGPNQQIKFLFGLINSDHQLLRIYNSLYFDVTSSSYKVEQSNSIPLIAFRLTNPNDITSIDLWSFKTRGITEQRGGVTILNNVINVTNGEKVAVKVNMKTQGKLNVMIMTIDGNIVTYLNHGDTSEGEHYYSWDGKNKNGKPVARGMYFIRVTGSGIDETRKVMVVK